MLHCPIQIAHRRDAHGASVSLCLDHDFAASYWIWIERDRIYKRPQYERAFEKARPIRDRARRKALAEAQRPAKKKRAAQASRDKLRAGLVAPEDTNDGRYNGVWRFDDRTVRQVLEKLKQEVPVRAFAGKDGIPSAEAISQRYRYDPVFAANADRIAPGRFRSFKQRGNKPRYGADVWDRVAEMLKAGLAVGEVAARPGMPSIAAISNRRRCDTEFAARVPSPAWRWTTSPDRSVWDAVLAHLRNGLSVHAVSKLEGMPTDGKIRHRMKTDRSFEQLVDQARRQWLNRKAEIVSAPVGREPTVPSANARLLTPDNLKAIRKKNGWSQEKLGQALGVRQDRISCWEAGRGTDPETADRVGGKIAELLGLRGKNERVTGDQIYAAAERAIDRRLAPDVRMDVISSIVMAVYDGSLQLSEIPARASEFVLAYKREFEGMKQVSLDQGYGSEGYTLGNALGLT
jgi:DNA-binding XRE family transcriptional regulator